MLKTMYKLDLVFIFSIFLVFFRLFLLSGVDANIPLLVSAGHDDRLFVNLAYNILSSKWLGAFDNLTLVKGIGYPLFICITAILEIPLQLAQNLLYISGAFYLMMVLRRNNFSERLSFIIFVLLLFNPIFASEDGSRFIRDSYYSGLIIWIFSLCVSFILVKLSSISYFKIITFSLLFTIIQITREEGVWLIPWLILVLAILNYQRKFFVVLSLSVTSLLLTYLANYEIKRKNSIVYGAPVITELQNSSFKKAYGALLRVTHEKKREHVPVPAEVREKIYNISPSFNLLRNYLENSQWKNSGCEFIDPCNDLSTHFLWAFRDAVSQAGFYSDLNAAINFYEKLAEEVNSACEDRRLICSYQSDTLLPPIDLNDVKNTLRLWGSGLWKLGTFDSLKPFRLETVIQETPQSRSLLELIGEKHKADRVTISGWVFDKQNRSIEVILRDREDKVLDRTNSSDVYQAFKSVGEYPQTRKARFSGGAECYKDCTLIIKIGDRVMQEIRIPTLKKKSFIEDESVVLHIDSIFERPVLFSRIKNIKLIILDKIFISYNLMFIVLAPISLLLFILMSTSKLLNRNSADFFSLILPLLTLALILPRVGLLALIEATSFRGITSTYFFPLYSMVVIFTVSTISAFYDNFIKSK